MRLQIIGADRILGAGIERLAYRHEKGLGRPQRLGGADAFLPALARQIAGCLQRRLKIGKCGRIIGNQILKPSSQSAGPAAPPIFGTANPVPHFGAFLRAQIQGKGTVGRIKHMMSLVKDIACGASPVPLSIAGWRIGGIHHDKCMVADDDIRPFRPAYRLLDKTAVIMRTGAVDTFATPVRKSDGLRTAYQVGQPGGKGWSCQIAILRRPGPARHQTQRRAAPRGAAQLAQRFIQIEKA